ncbi:MAG TPA: DMT family transporter [Candidatus Limnocylindrales bacterium]|nr:DMT family transporter [Candidatus Limnocylindrales bacterium]
MGLALALLAATLWGLTPVAIKGALDGYSPEVISVVRLALTTVFFRVLGGPGTSWLPRDRWTAIAGVALGADFLVYNHGVKLTTAGLASLVVNVEVVATILLALWLLGERLTPRSATGAAITLFGTLYVATEGAALGDVVAAQYLTGNLLVMLGGLLWSLYAVAQRRAHRTGSIFQLMAPIFGAATLTAMPGLAVPSAWQGDGGAYATMMLGALIVLCTIGVYVVYARSQELLDVSVLAVVLTSIPVFSIALAWLLLGETISARAAVGGAIILAGVLIISRERPAAEVAEGAPE